MVSSFFVSWIFYNLTHDVHDVIHCLLYGYFRGLPQGSTFFGQKYGKVQNAQKNEKVPEISKARIYWYFLRKYMYFYSSNSCIEYPIYLVFFSGIAIFSVLMHLLIPPFTIID